jgi:hypothetical protein
VVGPVEALVRRAAATEVERLPRRDGGDAGDAVGLALVRHRVDRVRGRRRQDQVGAVLVDELVRHVTGALGVRSAVLDDDLDLVVLAADAERVLAEVRVHLVDDERVRLAERRQRPVCGDTYPTVRVPPPEPPPSPSPPRLPPPHA